MGSFVDYGTTQQKGGTFVGYGSSPNEPLQLLEEAGYEVPKKKGWSLLGKKFINVLGGVLDVLRTGEYAMGGILAGKGPITGIREKISPSEVLLKDREEERKFWSKEGLTALAIDILLDPTTYITFGAGGGLKLYTKGGTILVNKSGKKLLTTMIKKGASEGAARRALARIIQEGGEEAAKKYIGKSGLRFMGQLIIPAEKFEIVGKAIKKLPGAGALNKIGNGFSRAFRPFREIELMPAKVGGEGLYTEFLYKPYVRETRKQIFKEIDNIKKKALQAYKEYGVDVGKTIGYKIETQKLTGDKFLDEIIKWMKKEQDEMLKIERATGKKIGEIKGYLRHYLTPEGRKFISEGNNFMSALPKPLRARLQAAKPRKIEGTIREINAFFREKYGIKNFFEPDAFKAFAMRKAEHIKYLNTHKFLEAAKARFGIRIDKATSTFVDGIRFVEPTNPQLKGWLLPEPIVKHLDDTLKFLTNEDTMRGFIKMYDKLLSIWKKNVTGYFPAFHTRNFWGGSFNNWLAGVKISDNIDASKILRGSDHTIKTEIGTTYTGKQILDLAERYGVMGQPGMMDVYRQVEEMVEEITASNLKKARLKLSNAPRWITEQVEDRLRLPLFINRLKKGYSPAEAAKDVFKFHFDYLPETGLTPFERMAMRRIIPFYTWTRNNVPLQIEMMMRQPGKYAGLEKLRQAMLGKEGKEEMKWLPEWMREMFIFKLPSPAELKNAPPWIRKIFEDDLGRSLWMQLDLPLDDIKYLPISSSGIREIASALTPFLKYPIELYMNRNFYFGGDIWNPDLPKEMQTRSTIEQLKILPKPIKKFLNFREVYYRDWRYPEQKKFIKRYEMDARALHFLMSFLGRYYSTLKGIFDKEVPPIWRASRYVGGIPVRPVDIEAEKDRREWEQEKQVEEMIRWLKQHKIIPYKQTKKKGTFVDY